MNKDAVNWNSFILLLFDSYDQDNVTPRSLQPIGNQSLIGGHFQSTLSSVVGDKEPK